MSTGSLFLRSLLVVLPAFLCLAALKVQASDFSVASIQKAYEGVKDIRGSFIQKNNLRDLKRTDTFDGTFIIRMPLKMRWQYRAEGKDHTEILIDGSEITIHQITEKQVFRGRFDDENYGQAPIALLSGFGNITKDFTAEEKPDKIILRPKKTTGTVQFIEVEPSGGAFPIGALTIIDRRSNRIDITFKNVEINTGVKDSAFQKTLPADISVFEYGQQR